MKRLIAALILMASCVGIATAQKGTAEPDYYPMGFHGDTWLAKSHL